MSMWFGGVCLDRVRPRLRAMARTAMGSTPQRREEITFFRRVYRDSIISERAFYYDARYYVFLHPEATICNHQDGATQEYVLL